MSFCVFGWFGRLNMFNFARLVACVVLVLIGWLKCNFWNLIFVHLVESLDM